MRVLLIEDDPMIGAAAQAALKDASCAADWVKTGPAGLSALAAQHYDLVLLDLGLPGKDGLDVLRTVRAKNNPVPVLVITARDGVDDRIAALDAGADDYILKPFEMNELLARMRAELLRRLLEYEQMKLAAAQLQALPQSGRDFLRAQVFVEQALAPRFPDVALADLQSAWADILRRAKLVQHHKISREELSVREHMSIVLRQLQGRRFALFEDLFDVRRGAPVLVVTLIALLELAKETLVEITQAEAYAPIYVRLAFTPS